MIRVTMVCFFAATLSHAAGTVVLKNFTTWDELPHIVVDDSLELTVAAADRVAKKMGMKPKGAGAESEVLIGLKSAISKTSALDVISREFPESYTPREIYIGRASFWGGVMPSAAFFLSRPPVDDSTFPVWPAEDGRSRYGFLSDAGRPDYTELFKGGDESFRYRLKNPKNNGHFEKVLLSAYRQEVDPTYADTLTDNRVYHPLSESTFERRLWLSPGYAMQYAYTDNIVSGSGTTLIAGSYVVEALSLLIMVGGALNGNTRKDRIAFVGLGAFLNIYWKISIGGLGRGPVHAHNKVVRSGYKIPPIEPRRQSRPANVEQAAN